MKKFTDTIANKSIRSFIIPLIYVLDRLEEDRNVKLFDILLDKISFEDDIESA